MHILVLDVGTSGMRGLLYDRRATLLFQTMTAYKVRSQGEIVEQDAADWKNSLYSILRSVMDFAQEKSRVIGLISLTSQRSSIIPIDYGGNPLAPTIMWQDTRNSEIIQGLKPHEEKIFQKTGAILNTVFSGGKMSWLAENRLDVYNKAYKLATVSEYLQWLLTDRWVIDDTYGSRSLLMNLHNRQWDGELLDIFGLDESKLSEIVSPGTVIGKTTTVLSNATGIGRGIPVVTAGGDQQCAALGQHITDHGTIAITVGTGGYVKRSLKRIPEKLSPEMLYSTSAVKGEYLLEGSIPACCALYNWFCQTLYHNDIVKMDLDIESAPAGANGCLVLPYLHGRGTPDWNPLASLVFEGIRTDTQLKDMARAVTEGIATELSINAGIMQKHGGPANYIHIGGGLSKLSAFNQMVADACGIPVYCYKEDDATAIGAWANATVASGIYTDLMEALKVAYTGRNASSYKPSSDNRPVYRRLKERTLELYERIFHN